MSPIVLATVISGIGAIISIAASLVVAGTRWGSAMTRLQLLEKTVDGLATKEQLSGVREDLAEIKGMFRMVPKEGP